MLQKRQQVQMERLQKDNHFERTNELKNLTHDHSNNPWCVVYVHFSLFLHVYEQIFLLARACQHVQMLCSCKYQFILFQNHCHCHNANNDISMRMAHRNF